MTNALTTPTALDLHRWLWGFHSTSTDKEILGVEQRVRRAIKAQFATTDVYPRGYGFDSRLRGDERRPYYGATPTLGGDPRDLRDNLRAWLGWNRRISSPRKGEIFGLIDHAKREAQNLLHDQFVSELRKERVHELGDLYTGWLGEVCRHPSNKIVSLGHGEALCLDCNSDVRAS